MTPNQFNAALAALDLSQVAAAKFLGYGVRTIHGWANGEQRVHPSVAKLLRLMVRLKLKPEDVK